MTDEKLSNDARYMLEDAGCYFDLYLITKIGTVRRVSVPAGLYTFTIFFCGSMPWSGIDVLNVTLDRWAARDVARWEKGYAEAMADSLHRLSETPLFDSEFVAMGHDKAAMKRCIADYKARQATLEQMWREANDDWRKHLPYALD